MRFVLPMHGALDQPLWSRKATKGVMHHSDRGSQYCSTRYTASLVVSGIESSLETTGDSYDDALD